MIIDHGWKPVERAAHDEHEQSPWLAEVGRKDDQERAHGE